MRHSKTGIRLNLTLLSLSIFCLAAAPAVNIRNLLADPKAYQGKSLSIEGIARVDGDYFTVYPDADGALKNLFTQGVSVRQKVEAPSYQRLNYHWVRVTGKVNTQVHGPYDAFPFEVLSEHIEPLERRPLVDPHKYIIFRNETGTAIKLVTSWRGGSAESPMGDRELEAVIWRPLKIEVFGKNGKLVVATSLDPAVANVNGSKSKERLSYFKITPNGLVRANRMNARDWPVNRILPWLQ